MHLLVRRLVINSVIQHPLLLLSNHIFNQIIHANYIKRNIKELVRAKLLQFKDAEVDEKRAEYIEELVITIATKHSSDADMDWASVTSDNNDEDDMVPDASMLSLEDNLATQADPDFLMLSDDHALGKTDLDTPYMLETFKIPQKVTWEKVKELVNSAVSIVIARDEREKSEMLQFKNISLLQLEERLKEKAPMVYQNMGSSMEFSDDPRF